MEKFICWLVDNLEWFVPTMITAFFAILNVIMAGRNLKIAKNQTKMQNDSFCYELFEQRWNVYNSIDSVFASIGNKGKVDSVDIRNFKIATEKVEFLFETDFVTACEETLNVLCELRAVGSKVEYNIRTSRPDPKHKQLCEHESELHLLLDKKKKKIANVAKKYIAFSNYKLAK